MKRVLALALNDTRNFVRDPLLMMMLVFPPLLALGARFGVPALRSVLMPGFDLLPYYPVFVVLVALIMPYIFGIMQAFMLLDERDDDVLVAIRTSPMPLGTFVGFRVATTTLFGLLLVILMVPVMGLSDISTANLILVAISAAPIGPLFALFVNLLANNKVAGFAVVKGTGFLLLIPVIALFIPAPWHLFMGAVPLYWPVMAFAQATGAANGVLPVWALALVGVLYQGALTVLVFGRFRAKLDRGS